MSEKITIKKQESSAKCGVCPKHNYNQENDIYSVTFNHNSNQGTIVNLCLYCMDEIIDNLRDFVEKEQKYMKCRCGFNIPVKGEYCKYCGLPYNSEPSAY